MSGSNFPFSRTGLLAGALCACLLGGCSDRDANSAERLAEINAAADRAEAAVAQFQKAGAPIPETEPEVEEPSPEEAPPPEEQPTNQP